MPLASPLRRTLLVALASLALTPAAALATPVDLRSPDTRDAATRSQPGQDLRSPDTRDAAAQSQTAQDLRSPDVRDAASRLTAAQDLRSPDTRDAAIRNQAALAQERYYSSSTRSVPQPLATAGPSGDGIAPLTFTVAIVAAVIVGLAAGSGLHVVRTRRRHTTGLAT